MPILSYWKSKITNRVALLKLSNNISSKKDYSVWAYASPTTHKCNTTIFEDLQDFLPFRKNNFCH
jgi:hypothetical protein